MSWRRPPALERIDIPLVAFMAAIVVCQLVVYWVYPAVPSHHPTRGWEGWWDQSQYLKSARAFAAFDLAENKHWYPIGYSLLAAPFVPILDDPFLVPNLASLILFAWMFQRYFRPLIGMAGVVAAFFGALALPLIMHFPLDGRRLLWLQFVVPWNTVPIAALLMTLLCLVRELRHDDALSKDLLIGALVGAVAAIKWVELMPLTVLAAWYLWVTLRDRSMAWRRIGAAAVGALAVAGPVLALTVYIHHGITSPYTDTTARIGMSFADLPQRTFDIFIDAGPTYGDANSALFGLVPWFPILAPLALVGAVLRARELLAPVAPACASFLTYLAYNDFSPVGFLHFFLIHYVVWTLPVIAACGLYMAVSVAHRPRWSIPCAVAMVAFCIIGALRAAPRPVNYSHVESRAVDGGRILDLEFAERTPLDAIDLPPNKALEKHPLFGNPLKLEIDGQSLETYTGYRLVEFPDRWRAIFTRPVDATHVSLSLPAIDPASAVDVRPIRFSVRFASSPWAQHSTDLNASAN